MSIFKKKQNKTSSQLKMASHITASISQFTHDIRGCLSSIRASTGNIKLSLQKNELPCSVAEQAINTIDKKINQTLILLGMAQTFLEPIPQYENESNHFSILECIKEAIAHYPYLSERYADLIMINNEKNDFLIAGNKRIIVDIFYCLIKNALNSIYSLGEDSAIIELEKTDHANTVNFKFIAYQETEPQDILSLGNAKKPGNAFYFIVEAMKSMKGNATFISDSPNYVTINLIFSK